MAHYKTLRMTLLFPVLTQVVNSKVALPAKAQQDPQFPWSLIGCMQLSLRQSTFKSEFKFYSYRENVRK